jgi:hypothetical protein
MVEMDRGRQTYTMQQNISEKMLDEDGKSRNLIARLHFSMVLLWRQLHRDFPRFANWSRSSGRWGNLNQVAWGQHPLLCALSIAKSLNRQKSIRSIGGTTIFWGRQYSRYSKAGGCRAAHLLGGSRRNLLIVCGWHRRQDVQLIFQEIDTAIRLFCTHSADLLKSYL